MKLIRPATISASNLTSNVVDDYAAWDSSTAYVVSNTVTRGWRYYVSIQNGTNKDPETEPDYWTDIGVSNVGAMFDNQTSTASTRADDITVTVEVAGAADSVALLYIAANSVNVTVSDGVDEYFNEDFSLVDNSGIDDWYSYFFEPLDYKTEFFLTGLPNVYNPEITITTEAPGGTVSIGHCVVGFARELGETQYGAQVGFDDYSKINVDALGVPESITPRAQVRRNRFTVWVEADKTDYVHRLLGSFHATPVVVIGAEQYASTYGFGLLTLGGGSLSFPSHSVFDIELKGF